jgi:hypothetical protein
MNVHGRHTGMFLSSGSWLPKNPAVHDPVIDTNLPWIPRHCVRTKGTERSKGANLDVQHTLTKM